VTSRQQAHRTISDPAIGPLDAARDAPFDAYHVISAVAHGGTSTVYLGEHRATGARVAIKMLDALYAGYGELADRLLHEHALARRVRHPGLLDIRHAGRTSSGTPYLAMEYLDGESLGALVDRLLPIAEVIAIGAQIASAATALHAAGIVHCDLKPGNVIVLRERGPGGRPRVKVIDYGVARLVDEPPLAEGMIAGTPAFMAPEQWHGAPSPKSDVYALGCLLYLLVTGEPVFCGGLRKLMLAHGEQMPERPAARRPDLDPSLDRLIVRALAKDPALRPTMADACAELTRLTPLGYRAREEIPASLAERLEATG